jgi:hypothetical protein
VFKVFWLLFVSVNCFAFASGPSDDERRWEREGDYQKIIAYRRGIITPGYGMATHPGPPGGNNMMGYTPEQVQAAQPRIAQPSSIQQVTLTPILRTSPLYSTAPFPERSYVTPPTIRNIEERNTWIDSLPLPPSLYDKTSMVKTTNEEHAATLKTLHVRYSKIRLRDRSRAVFTDVGFYEIEAADTASIQRDTQGYNNHLRLSEECLSLAIGLNPITALGSSLYEFMSGKNLITGAELDTLDRSLALAGVMTFGIANRIPRFARTVIQVYERNRWRFPGSPTNIEPIVNHAKTISKGPRSDFDNMREAVRMMREEGVDNIHHRRDAVEAFTREGRVVTLIEDTPVIRYWVNGFSNPRGNWVVRQRLENPHRDLALPHPGPYNVKEWTIPAGTRIIEGPAGPNFNQPGGETQIYVPNRGVLN